MALAKQTIIGKIEILPDGQLQIRQDTIILEDGIELSHTYHRMVLAPGDDTSAHEVRTQNIAKLLWAPDVIKTYKDKVVQTSFRLPLTNGFEEK